MRPYILIPVITACSAVVLALADEPATIRLGVDVEIQKATKICPRAIALLKADKIPLSQQEAEAFVTVDGQQSLGKCLEVILSYSSSPTNGYEFRQVTSEPQTADVGSEVVTSEP